MHCNGSNRFSFVNPTYHSKAKDSKMKKCPLCLGNSSENFSANNMKKKNMVKWVRVRFFSVDYRALDTSNIINVHKYLLKTNDRKECLG